MRLFKANQSYQSEEDRARDARLTNIASRYRERPSNDLAAQPQTEAPQDPEPPL